MFLFFYITATSETYTLSLHDALPIFTKSGLQMKQLPIEKEGISFAEPLSAHIVEKKSCRTSLSFVEQKRSEEHTSELQSRENLVCRHLLEKKKKKRTIKSNRK